LIKQLFKEYNKKLSVFFAILKYSKLRKIGDLTIISNNCIAGFLYQKYGLKYCSPTIGLQFPQNDFVKFCSNFKHYLNCELEESIDQKQDIFKEDLGGGKVDFPVGKIDDIIIYFQHFKDFSEAKNKWEARKNRINYNKLFFVFVAYDNTSADILKEFERLPIKNKIIITNKERSTPPPPLILQYILL
jgi:uncharacterized protein (DUF1919 family)